MKNGGGEGPGERGRSRGRRERETEGRGDYREQGDDGHKYGLILILSVFTGC